MLSVEMDERYVKAIDAMIAKSGKYSSRSEFLKDSIRKNFDELLKTDEDLRKIHEGLQKLKKLAYERGYDGRMPTREEKEKIAREYLKKKGIKIE